MGNAAKTVSKKWILSCGMVFAVIYSLNCFVISPATSGLLNDVIYSESFLPTLLGYFNELTELAAVSFCYAVLILTVYREGKCQCVSVFIVFICATLYKYLANTAMAWVLNGNVPKLWGWDIVNVFYYSVLELLQFFVVYLLVKRIIIKYTDKRLVMERALEKVGEDERERAEKVEEIYPFKKVFDLSNCLLKSAFVCSVVMLVAKLLGALLSDIWLIVAYGAPEDGITWLYMAINYLSRIIMGVISYLVVYLSMTVLAKSL